MKRIVIVAIGVVMALVVIFLAVLNASYIVLLFKALSYQAYLVPKRNNEMATKAIGNKRVSNEMLRALKIDINVK